MELFHHYYSREPVTVLFSSHAGPSYLLLPETKAENLGTDPDQRTSGNGIRERSRKHAASSGWWSAPERRCRILHALIIIIADP